LHQTEMLQAIADWIGDTSQTADVTIHGFSILPQLKVGAHSSPLNGVINKSSSSQMGSELTFPTDMDTGVSTKKSHVHSRRKVQPRGNSPTHLPKG